MSNLRPRALGSGVLAVAFEVGADFSPDAGYAHFLFLNGFLRLFQVGGRMFKDIQKAEQLFLGAVLFRISLSCSCFFSSWA